jgi:uncharacterized membrane protein (UPF0127 family)
MVRHSIVLTVRVLHGFWEKSRGLIGTPKAYPVLFTTRFGIHTFGVRFPIDVLILDEQQVVVKLATALPPNRFFFWPLSYSTVVELPSGEIQRQKITVGEKIHITYLEK